MADRTDRPRPTRRDWLAALAGMGVGSAAFQRALAAQAADSPRITAEMIADAEWIAGLELSEDQRAETASAMERLRRKFDALRAAPLDPAVPPALAFHAAPPQQSGERGAAVRLPQKAASRPGSDEQLAFLPVTELASLLRRRQVTSVELTKLYLARLKRYDPALKCVVSLTEELALRQAEQADREMEAGHYRGPLHGVPWGAKDLIAYPGYKTTWGAAPYKEQVLNQRATVAERLDEAGAVLVAKLTLGALAWGDNWFGGRTNNPWNVAQGSSGSSAGSASATAAGLVGFSLGSETMGSIVSPCRRCGTTGLRPTFGRVSRWGCMPLAWSMDKIGPITRGVEDCALILGAIHGADGRDATAVDRPFQWPSSRDLRSLKIGYVDDGRAAAERDELRVLGDLGATLQPIELPADPPADALHPILNVEAATVFDELTRSGSDEGLFRWPGAFRQGQLTPAVEYLRAQRFRHLLMAEMDRMFDESKVDLYVEGRDLAITNFTGHPTVVLRKTFVEADDREFPVSFTMTGRLFGETELLTAALGYEQATTHHQRHPDMSLLEPSP